MKQNRIFLFLGFLLGGIGMYSQTYTFSPSNVFYTHLDTSELVYRGIEITNTGSTNLDLTWELILKDTLLDSEFDLCNSGICFNTLPVSGVMPTMHPGEVGFLKMHMFSGRTMGLNTIKYILKNGSTRIDTLTYFVTVGNITGIKNINNLKDKVVVFPNPASTEAFIRLDLVSLSEVSVSVLNVFGQTIQSEKQIGVFGENKIPLNTKSLSNGIYSIIIKTVNGELTTKLIVTK
jgi:hypothetical protein